MDNKILIIIPAYNEAQNIEKVVKSISGRDYIIINDGSTDDTAKICRENGYNFIDLPVNLGLIGAFQTGLKYALKNGYDYALQFDGDGQHQSKFIDGMLSFAVENDADIVIGSRFVDEKKPLSARMLGSRLISGLIWLFTHKKISDPTSGMRLYNSKIIKAMANDINLGPEPDTISYFLKCKASVMEFQVEMKEREAGESYLNFSSSIKYMWKMCCSILILQIMRGR